MILGLTGGIGSGKSTAVETFKQNGAIVIDADKISREVIGDVKIIEKIQSVFPEAFVEGEIDRRKMRNIVFSESENILKLNNITHPEIIKRITEEIEKNRNEKIVVVDVPLLFEVGLDKAVEKTLVIICEDEVRVERIMKRDSCGREEVEKMIKSQMPQEKKEELSDFIIRNNGTLKQFKRETVNFIHMINKNNASE